MSQPRYHGLDALRAFAMLLGIALHGGMSYIGDYLSGEELVGWPFDTASSGFILVLILWIHAWRMQVFFFMAGFFAHLVIQRYGIPHFVRNRFHHIFLPFVLGMIIIVPLTIGVIIYGAWRAGTLNQLANSEDEGGLSPLHLWFLYYLLGYYLITVVVCRAHSLSGVVQRMDSILSQVMRSRLRVVWLTLPTMLLRTFVRSEDVTLFAPNVGFFVYHGSFFALGWFIFRQPSLLSVLRRKRVWVSYLLLGSLVMMPVTLIFTDLVSEQHLAYTALYSLQTWLIMLGLIGMFDALNSQAHDWVRYLADAAYWIYLVHMPVVALLSIWLLPLSWAALFKFGVVCAVSTLFLLATYHWGVRYTFIGRLLNGPRQRRVLSPTPG